jgi:hypothetical protein
MASNTRFEDILKNRGSKKPLSSDIDKPSLPVKGGRESIPDGALNLSVFLSEMQNVTPDFNIDFLKGLEKLSIFNSDFSYAVENIVTLGNTPYKISFDDQVPEEQVKEMQLRLVENSKKWYAYSGGISSFINDALAQTAINGCLSAEVVPNLDLTGVEEIVKVSPKTIRFKLDAETKKYKAVQIQGLIGAGRDYVELNPLTYHYIALRRIGDKPYAIPPFISALEQISIERDITGNLASTIKNVGALGFLEVLVNAPAVKPNENEEEYYNRTKRYLDMVTPEIDKGLARGYSVGFKDKHEFKMHNTSVNVSGAKDLIEINDIKKMSGFKQDPLMFGRNFSTTETLGRVILAKMTTQVVNYQQIVASFLETAFLMDLQLAGYSVKRVFVEFEKPLIGDRGKEEEARAKQIDNLSKLYNQGIIDQNQFASEAGYEKPANPEPLFKFPNPADEGNTEEDEDSSKNPPKKGKKEDDTEPTKTDPDKESSETIKNVKSIAQLEVELGGMLPEFPYETESCCGGSHQEQYNNQNQEPYSIGWWSNLYSEAVRKLYAKSVKKMTGKIVKNLSNLTIAATEEQITDNIVSTLYREWGITFNTPMRGIVKNFVQRAYTYFRKDKSIFGNADIKIPNGAFNTIDFRSLDYYKNSDSVYLGKFITDEQTKAKITQFIKDKYLTRERWIGRDAEGIEEFKKEFGEVLQGQDWKIQQIINTTVSNMRNTAAVNYFDEAGVVKFEIRGVNDRLQCKFCSNMQGKVFSVKKGLDIIKDTIDTDVQSVGFVNPFLNSKFKNPDEIENLTGEDLQGLGINTPAYHPNCRDRIVPLLD